MSTITKKWTGKTLKPNQQKLLTSNEPDHDREEPNCAHVGVDCHWQEGLTSKDSAVEVFRPYAASVVTLKQRSVRYRMNVNYITSSDCVTDEKRSFA